MYLSEEVGIGRLRMGVDVNQPYAQNQHENLEFDHTVGRAHYLGAPLMENTFNFIDGLARAAITEEGSRIHDEAIDIAEDMSQLVFKNAPRDPDIGDVLANSGSPWVESNGIEIFRRPPIAGRRLHSERGWEERPPEKYL
jgi:hypothetical protein